jgi:peptide/nickel transport system permease protein
MRTYVLRRLLQMIPTFFGISMVIWLVMLAAPGRPGGKGRGFGEEQDRLDADPSKLAEENEAQKLFLRQFGLDRPPFFNNWLWLKPQHVRAVVETASAPIEEVGAGRKREARELLQNYGYYSVPALVALLQQTEGEEQDHILYWLRINSVRSVVKPYGESLTKEQVRLNTEWRTENITLKPWTWAPGAPQEERQEVVAKWRDWYEANKARWQHGFLESAKLALTDTQFGTYWGRLLKGDLGVSHVHKVSVWRLIGERMKYTLSLNVVALVIIYLLAVPLGVIGAVKQGGTLDKTIAVIVFALYSLPNFFVGTLLVKWFATGEPWKIFPIGGFDSENAAELNTLAHLKDILWHITMPLVCLVYGGLAALSQFARSGMLDVIRSDYVRTARAKGLSEWNVILKHVVRNGILPIVTILGTSLPILVGGSVVVEYIFNINGMGLLMIESIFQRDYNVVMGVELIAAALVMIGILLSDIGYAMLDPRISYT